jgi:hypothetical protein
MKICRFIPIAIAGLLFTASALALPTLQGAQVTIAENAFNSHASKSAASDVSDAVLLESADLDAFGSAGSVGDNGTIALKTGAMRYKPVFVATSAFDDRHVDMHTYESDLLGGKLLNAMSNWDVNPDDDVSLMSDVHLVPAPGALLLATIGAAIVGWLRKSRSL